MRARKVFAGGAIATAGVVLVCCAAAVFCPNAPMFPVPFSCSPAPIIDAASCSLARVLDAHNGHNQTPINIF